jgi:hypothetical protein
MQHFKMLLKLSLTSVLLLFSLNAQAVHKWVDADGNVTYSDTLPPDVEAQTLRSSGSSNETSTRNTPAQKSLAEREAELKKSKLEKNEAAQKNAQKTSEAETKIKNCESARESLRALESGNRISTIDANGERIILDDVAIQQRITEARRVTEKNCN